MNLYAYVLTVKKKRSHKNNASARRQLKSLRASRRRQRWLKAKRRSQIGISTSLKQFYTEKKIGLHINAPKIFSVKKNPNHVFKFIRQIKEAKNKSKINSVFIVLDDCEYISSGAIALMISAIRDLRVYGISCSGSYPEDPYTRNILEKSGFFNFVRGNIKEENKVTQNTITQQGIAIVDPALVAPIVLRAMTFIFGKPYRNQRIQSLLVELMANTINHAFPKQRNSKWYLSSYFDEENKRVSFTFIDNGQGILNTLNLKYGTLIRSLFLNSNESILDAAFDGKFGSRTKEIKRGRGLPNVKKCFTENYITKLVVIANDVYLDFENNRNVKLKEDFDGTCIYWELDLTCQSWKIL